MQCMFSAQGTYTCPAGAAASAPQRERFSPAFVDEDAKKAAWADRSAAGHPMADEGAHASSHGWVGEAEGFVGHTGGAHAKKCVGKNC